MATAAAQNAASFHAAHDTMAAARRAMIDSQLRTSGINERFILDAMARVPREEHVRETQRTVAYTDRQLPLGEGRAMAAPLTHARLLLEARPRTDDTALLIGGGTGYLARLLAPLVASLHVVEPDGRLAALAAENSGTWHETELARGWKKGAPYSLIVVDGAVEALSKDIVAQLAENGRLVTGTVDRGVTRIALGRKSGKDVPLQPIAEIGVPVLSAFARPAEWRF